MNLDDFQQYVKAFCEEKGFSNVSDEERYLFFMSEVGEMSEELLNLRFAEDDKQLEIKKALSHEIFDVIWNAVEIANRQGINLTQAFKEKMEINSKRSW
ncbi:MazG nucleotide pyrophosphohydrolase domain-containing protein [Lentibacillus salicampi]|uniref:Pyrophosphatase n=1 Tax=Lentibacillus salicampi TaxID=175306 RepID=A0A4Y9ACB5_9BACI|nr:MazG nucleotide pyrophosphohydrolase domain-containing protein [Lentibacillus salicampi]TFJ92034.1 pyrophosphatase [Lentibacillus salicampi]